MKNGVKQYLPSLAMVAAAALGVLYTALGDNHLSLTEALNLVVASLGAVTTYIVPRLQGMTWLKPLVAALTAVAVALISAYVDGSVSAQEWVTVVTQFLVGLGVVVMTNDQVPETPKDTVIANPA